MHNIGYMIQPENIKRDWVVSLIVEEADNNGDGYNGPLHWHDEIAPLENRDAAEAKIRQLDHGFYDDHAVRFYDYSKSEPTKKILDLQERITETKAKMRNYAEEHSVTAFKAQFVSCQNCGAKLPRIYLRSDYCPVCRNDMRSETTKNKLVEYGQKIDALNDQIDAEKRKQKSARRVMWLIKYEYHS